MNLQPLKSTVFIFILLITFTSCTKDDINADTQLTSIAVKLKSTGEAFDKVFIEIEDVQLKVKKDGNAPNAWVSLNVINKGTYNLFDLRENSELQLVTNFEMNATYIYEIRLVLGDNNYVDLNHTLYSLDVSDLGNATPSNLVKLELVPNRIYDFEIGIDLDNSLSFNEDQNMMVLNPKLYTEIRQN